MTTPTAMAAPLMSLPPSMRPSVLYLAFRLHLDTVPMACLRRVQLDHAHNDPVAAGAGTELSPALAYWQGSGDRVGSPPVLLLDAWNSF